MSFIGRSQLEVNFNRSNQVGQMSPDEREAMYNLVIKYKPRNIFEIGTWMGCGSTYYLAAGLYNVNNDGMLYTAEAHIGAYNHALNFYKTQPDLIPLRDNVEFHFGTGVDIFTKKLKEFDKVDMVLFDGADDNQTTLDEYNVFKDKFKTDTIVICHDWKTRKAEYIKDFLLDDTKWKQLFIMDTLTGFAAFKKK